MTTSLSQLQLYQRPVGGQEGAHPDKLFYSTSHLGVKGEESFHASRFCLVKFVLPNRVTLRVFPDSPAPPNSSIVERKNATHTTGAA